VGLFFVGCDLPSNTNTIIQTLSTPQPIDSGFILPLSVGNEWNYKDTGFDFDGTIKFPEIDFSYNLRIKKDTVIGGNLWSQIVSLPESNDAGFREWLSNRQNGLWEGYPQSGDSLTWLRLPYPAEAGTKATARYDEWWVVSNNVMVTVPAGTFRCYHYKVKSLGNWSYGIINDYFYSPNIGLIRINGYTHTGDSTSSVYIYIQRNLISYKVAP
jgi:hypothetical protein